MSYASHRSTHRAGVAALLALCTLLGAPSARVGAQEVRTITYAEALQLAVQRNVDYRQAQSAAASDAVAVAQAKRNLLPDLRFTTQERRTTGATSTRTTGRSSTSRRSR